MAGLSLVELMISIALGLIVLSSVIGVFVNTSAARTELERTSRQIENGRYAVDLLTDDLRLGGFYGELKVLSVARPGALPDPCSTATADWSSAIPIHIQGYHNGAGAPSCMPTNVKANTDILVVRRAATCVAGSGGAGSGCEAAIAGTPYLQVSLCSTETTTPYRLGIQGTATFDRTIKDCAAAAGRRQYLVHIYYISNDNGAVPPVPVPTLKRRELTGAAFVEVPLVEGIENLQIEYGVDYKNNVGPYAVTDDDSKRDGIADAYTADPTTFAAADCPTTTCTAVNNWSNVVTVRLYLLARNIDPSPAYTDTKTYTLGHDSTFTPPSGDHYRRHIYTSLVRIMNPAGRRDTP